MGLSTDERGFTLPGHRDLSTARLASGTDRNRIGIRTPFVGDSPPAVMSWTDRLHKVIIDLGCLLEEVTGAKIHGRSE
jgi:hypothetical protein